MAQRGDPAGPSPSVPSAWRHRIGLLSVAAGFLAAVGWALFWTWRTTQLMPPGRPPSLARVSPTPAPSPSGVPTASPTASSAPGASPLAPATTRLVFALSPTLLRGEGGSAPVHIPPGTDTLVFEMEGDPRAVPLGARLAVAIDTVEGTRVWSGPARRGGGRSTVAATSVPAGPLPPGDYLATLSSGGQVLHRYFFRVR